MITTQDMEEMRREAHAIRESKVFKERGYKPFLKAGILNRGIQTVHTPFELCYKIISKLSESVDIKEQQICVLFNLEFAIVLIEDFGGSPSQITFIADCPSKGAAARHWYNIKKVLQVSYDKARKNGERIKIMPKLKKQFNVVIMNPPYQAVGESNAKGGGSGSRNTIWDRFVLMALELLPDGGYLAAVHPVRWRKPEDKMFNVIASQDILYLQMYSKNDGIKIFGASTPFDWYVLQKSNVQGKTVIVDAKGKKRELRLRDFSFIPNCDFDKIAEMLASENDERCEILANRSTYEHRKKWMREDRSGRYKHPCVHATGMNEIRYWYSSKRGEFFGVPKLIFGEADYVSSAIVDDQGEYAMTEGAMAIPIASKKEGEEMKKALESSEFNELLKNALRYSQFRIEYKIFRHFKADFWKEFV